MRRFVLACVTAAALLTGAVGASAAHATTVTIGQVADAGQVFPGSGCTNCRAFPRSTDNASPSYAVPAGNWVLTSWSTRAGTAATGVRMFLVESAGGNNYTLQGQSAEVSIEAEKINTYPAQIPVQSGWRLGLDSGDGHTLAYQTVHADDVTAAYPNETVGTSAPILGELPGFLVNVTAKLESDCDNDGLGDETQDTDTSSCRAAPPTCKGKPATIVGTPGKDVRSGTPGPDVMVGLGGNDNFSGLGGDDVICGAKGNDTLRGGPGNDTLLGQKGDDNLLGNQGKDKLSGKKGNDRLKGAGASDKLKGGGGSDICIGGKANDSASKCEVEKSV